MAQSTVIGCLSVAEVVVAPEVVGDWKVDEMAAAAVAVVTAFFFAAAAAAMAAAGAVG